MRVNIGPARVALALVALAVAVASCSPSTRRPVGGSGSERPRPGHECPGGRPTPEGQRRAAAANSDLVFLVEASYPVGEELVITLRNRGKRTFVYKGSGSEIRVVDPCGERLALEPRQPDATVIERIPPGGTVGIRAWRFEVCADERCDAMRQLLPGTYRIVGAFEATDGGPPGTAEATFRVVARPAQNPEIELLVEPTYGVGENAEVSVRNRGRRTLVFPYILSQAACGLSFLDSTRTFFRVPSGMHCDLISETEIGPGETLRLLVWPLDECVRSEGDWCDEARPLRPGTYTIAVDLEPAGGGARAHAEATFRVMAG